MIIMSIINNIVCSFLKVEINNYVKLLFTVVYFRSAQLIFQANE